MSEFKNTDPDYWDKRKKTGKSALKKIRGAVGAPKLIKSPEELWGYACDYFKRCDETPWKRTDYKGKDAIEVEIPTSTPYLWSGLEDYLFEIGICKTLKDYRTASRKDSSKMSETDKNRYERYLEFSEVITRIDKIMTTQKLSGALVGAYSPNLVARLEDLVDKKEETVIVKEARIGFE